MTFPYPHLSLAQIDAIERDRKIMSDPECYNKCLRNTRYKHPEYEIQVVEHFKLVPRVGLVA